MLPSASTCAAAMGWITFESPGWLAALIAVAAPLLAAWIGRRRRRRIHPAAVAVQCLALAAAAMALARPRAAVGPKARLGYLLAVDASGSVAGQGAAAAAELPRRFGPGAAVERFYFAGGLSRTPPAAVDATDAAPVLQMIAHRARGGLAGAVIATDGRFTVPGWPAAAAALAGFDGEVLIVPLNAPPPDSRLVALTARRTAGGAVELAVSVDANAPLKRTLVIRRTHAGGTRELLRRALALLPDAPATVRLADDLHVDSAAEYHAALLEPEAVTQNNSARAIVLPARSRVALAGDAAALGAFAAAPFAKAERMDPSQLPADLARLSDFAAIVLVDPTGSALRAAQRKALGEYVRGGGGLLLVGAGPHATPADADDPLNRVAALAPNPFRRRRLHLFVLLDRSGSMAERTRPGPDRPEQVKFDIAAEAVVALERHLTAADALTVLTFAADAETVYDSAAAAPDFADLRRRLRGVRPGGPTRITPALARALTTPVAAGRRTMLLVLSDLATESFDPAGWADRLRRMEARLAVVAVGRSGETRPAAASPLERLVEALGDRGICRRCDRFVRLAEVFGSLVRQGRGSILRAGPAAVTVSGALFGTGLKRLGDLDAYLLAAEVNDAEVLARVGADPILARRQVGLGRSVGLALPVDDRHNRAWPATPEARRLLAAAVAWAARPGNDPRFSVELSREPGRLAIEVRAVDAGRPVNGLELSVAVEAAGSTAAADLHAVAPGRYRGQVPCPTDRPAAVVVRDGRGATVWRGSGAVTAPAEYRRLGADLPALRRLAELTGGRVVSADELAPALRRADARRKLALWPWLAALALALMLAEWCLARVTRR